jgi:hypothetical protein
MNVALATAPRRVGFAVGSGPRRSIVDAAPAVKAPRDGYVRITTQVGDAPAARSTGWKRIATWAAAGAAYGALVGAGTAGMYNALGFDVGTPAHMTGIIAGGAAGAAVLGRELQPTFDKGSAYAIGALAGAGMTWGTSAFGLLQNPVLGAVMGGVLGASYAGAAAAMIPH